MPRYSQQSPYPTGRAPLAFDLSEQMWNIAQQRIQNRKQEIEEQKKEISDNEKILLTALDFETVKGAQDKFTLDMAGRMKTLTDKWALRMKDRTGILTTEDKLELLRDKRDIESRMQVGAANVAQYDELRKQVYADEEGKIFDKKKSLENLGRFALNGNIGYKSPMDAVIMQPQPFGQEALAKYGSWLEETQNPKTAFKSTTKTDLKTGVITTELSNEEDVNAKMDLFEQTPEVQQMLRENPIETRQWLDLNRKALIKKPQTSGVNSGLIGKTKTGKEEFSSDYPGFTKQAEVDAANNYNDFAERLYQGDESAIEQLKGTKYASVEVYPDKYILTENDDKGTKKIVRRDVGKKAFKHSVWDVAPDSVTQGLTNFGLSSFIKEDYNLSSPIKKAEITPIRDFKSLLSDANSVPAPESVMTSVKEILPEANISYDKTETGWFGRKKGKEKIIFGDKPYDLDIPDDRKKLMYDVLKEYDSKNKQQEETESSEEIPVEPEVQYFKMDSTLRDSIINQYTDYDTLVDAYVKETGEDQAVIENALEFNGITPDAFAKKKK